MCRLIEFVFHLDSKTCNTCMHPWIIYIHVKLILSSDRRLALQTKAGLYRSNSFLFHFEKWSQHVDSFLIYSTQSPRKGRSQIFRRGKSNICVMIGFPQLTFQRTLIPFKVHVMSMYNKIKNVSESCFEESLHVFNSHRSSSNEKWAISLENLSSTCTDPESFSEGVQLWRFFLFCFFNEWGDPNNIKSRQLSAHQPRWLYTEYWLVALWFFRGSRPGLHKHPIDLFFLRGGSAPLPCPPPPPPSGFAHATGALFKFWKFGYRKLIYHTTLQPTTV